MAEHKVPQDIEAEDKVLGPFGFRQFVYLLIAVGGGFAAFALGQVVLPLAIIPLPISFLFLVIALPLRKDQSMETYVAAMFRFWFSARLRLWDPDGSEMMVEITNPPIDDDPIGRKIKGDEAIQRLSLLSDIEDTQGWVTRGVVNNTSLNDDLVATADQVDDVLEDGSVADQFNNLLDKSSQNAREKAISQMNEVRENISPAPENNPVSSPSKVRENPENPENSIPQNENVSPETEIPAPSQVPENPQTSPLPEANPYMTALEQPQISAPAPVQIPLAQPTAEDESATAELLAKSKIPELSEANEMKQKVIQPLNEILPAETQKLENSENSAPENPEIRENIETAPISESPEKSENSENIETENSEDSRNPELSADLEISRNEEPEKSENPQKLENSENSEINSETEKIPENPENSPEKSAIINDENANDFAKTAPETEISRNDIDDEFELKLH